MYFALGDPVSAGAPRVPRDDGVYAVESWAMGPLTSGDGSNNTAQASRLYRRSTGLAATLTIFSNQAPKLYGAGAEVPFLGNGYAVEPLVSGADVGTSSIQGLIARQGDERWLVLFAYGERRGLLGNGLVPWTLAFIDGLVGSSNDYYKLYLASRIDQPDANATRDVVDLANTLFPRIAASYALSH